MIDPLGVPHDPTFGPSDLPDPRQSPVDPVAGQYERWIYPAAVDDLRQADFAAADVRMRDLREALLCVLANLDLPRGIWISWWPDAAAWPPLLMLFFTRPPA